jgi:hypothetical protein
MRFETSPVAIGLVVAAVVAISQTSLAQTPIAKPFEISAITKFIAIGTLASPDSTPAPSLALQEDQATLNLYLNGKVEQIWLREDGMGVVLIMAASTRGEAAELLQKLPYAQASAIKFDLIPVGPMMSLLDDPWFTGRDSRVAQIFGDLAQIWFGQRLRREYMPRY